MQTHTEITNNNNNNKNNDNKKPIVKINQYILIEEQIVLFVLKMKQKVSNKNDWPGI